jgi:integrase
MKRLTVNLNSNGPYWLARWRDLAGKPRGKSLGLRAKYSKRQARMLCGNLERDLNAGRLKDGPAPALERYCEAYLDGRQDLAEGTLALYRDTIRALTKHFGSERPIDTITKADARDWRGALARGELSTRKPSEATSCRYTREAKALFGQAVDDDLLPGNPFGKLCGAAPAPDKTWAYIDQPTLDRTLEACPSDSWRLLLLLCRLAGLRQGEALALEWSDVDWDRRRLRVRNRVGKETTKSRAREVPIEPDLFDRLFEAFADGGGASIKVIQKVRQENVWRDFRKICDRAGLTPWAKWCHTLRKNCETDWSKIMPMPVVTEWLGNSVQVAMRHYVRAEASDFARISQPESAQKRAQNGVENKDKVSS